MKKLTLVLFSIFFITLHSIAQDKGEVGINESITQQRKKWLEVYKLNYPTIFQKNIEANPNIFFLFTYLPISEIVSHNELFFQKQIDIANITRSKMAWGKTIPDLIFKNYVLNPLVYNERLDTIRNYMSPILKKRVEGMSMQQACVEIGYWCRENIIALPWSSHNGSSLASLNAQEVSFLDAAIFQVAALRSISIPARLGYIPALSHTNGEMFFIEAWIDEKWTLISPNEPRKILEQSWTKAMIERSMAAYTQVIGNDQLNENTEVKTTFYQVQNILKPYAPQTKIEITAIDSANNPIANIPVSLMLVKDATLFPFITKPTDSNGKCTFYSGYGTMIAYAALGENIGFEFINTNQIEPYKVKLTNHYNSIKNYLFNQYPPSEKFGINKVISISSEEIEKMYFCDSIRKKSHKTDSLNLVLVNKYKIDGKYTKYIEKSNSNAEQTAVFIKNNVNNFYFQELIDVLSPKTLQNTSASNLKLLIPENNNIKEQKDFFSDINYKNFILNPQIDNEPITPWRSYFDKTYPSLQKLALKDIKNLINHVNNTIRIIPEEENYTNHFIQPIDVDKLKIADSYSRDIYFIALCRTFGIPAQWSSNFKKPVIYDGSEWKLICFDSGDLCIENYNSTIALIEEKLPLTSPVYGVNYSFSKYENNKINAFQISNIQKPTDSPKEFKVENGLYASLTTSRTPSGVAFANLNFYQANGNIIHGGFFHRNITQPRETYGSLDPKNSVTINTNPPSTLTDLYQTNGAIVAFINPCEYASLAAVYELIKDLNFYNSWKGNVLIYVPDKMSKIMMQYLKDDMPKNMLFIEDNDNKMQKYFASLIHFDFSKYLPALFIINRQSDIVYFSNTYRNDFVDEFFRFFKDYDLINDPKKQESPTLKPIFEK